jgi:hypothetical protein
METLLQAKKKALQMADSGDKETGLSDLTTQLDCQTRVDLLPAAGDEENV